MQLSAKQKLRQKLLALAVSPLYLISNRGFLAEMGWFKSVRKNLPVDSKGEAVPWWSYSFILFLEERLDRSMRVFEYGSGNSTLWLAKRVAGVVSVEAEKDWYERVNRFAPGNVDVRYVDFKPDGEYCHLIEQQEEEFDIVVVDGRDRIRCAKNAITALSSEGIIIVDDAHRPHMLEAGDYLRVNGFRKLDFFGIAPMQPGKHCTSVFYRESNCLGI